MGRTLYGFKNDKNMKNNYTKSDFSNNALWPLYEETLKEVPSTIDKTLFGSITVFGRQQLTFKGWPLYYFSAGQRKTRSEQRHQFSTTRRVAHHQ